MASRHHYSIPGASLLKPKSSSKRQSQKPSSSNVPSSSRDTGQSSSSRAFYTQESMSRPGPPSRPPSVSGYRVQQPAANVDSFPAPGSSRPPPTQRPSVTPQPQASSSKTRLDVPEPQGYFSKMFGRKSPSTVPQAEDKHENSHKQQRSSNAQVPISAYPPSATMSNQPPATHSSTWGAYEALTRARTAEREERAKQKAREERMRAERAKEEPLRADYKAKLAAEQAAAAKMTRTERTALRPSREDQRPQEYESDSARRRQQPQQMVSSSGYRQETRRPPSQHPHPTYQVNTTRTTMPAQDAQQTPALQQSLRQPGIPIQHSASSQSTSASNQVHVPHTTVAPAPVAPPTPSANPVIQSQCQSQSQNQSQSQSHPGRTSTPPPAPKMLPMYLPPGTDDRTRLFREATERDAHVLREREREGEKEKEREKEKEKGRDREKVRLRETEERRARRAERERQKELERAERERQKELERAERERRKELERTERERQEELVRSTARERQRDLERTEKERQKALERAEQERRKEVEKMEHEKLREKEREREYERGYRSSSKHRSYRDKLQSLPGQYPGATSGSDTERLVRKEGKHRSQSHPTAASAETRPMVAPSAIHRTESRRESVLTPEVQSSVSKQDQIIFSQLGVESPALPVPPPLAERQDHVLYPRSVSVVPSTSQSQQLVPPKIPDRSRTDLILNDRPIGSMSTNAAVTRPQPLPPAIQSKLISIYASQGPPDRTPSRSTHMLGLDMPIAEQIAPISAPSLPSAGGHDEQARSSYDHPSVRTSTTVLTAPAPAPTPAPQTQTQPQSRPSTLLQAPSAAPLHQTMITMRSQPPMNDTTLTPSIPSFNPQPQPDMFSLPPSERAVLSSGTSLLSLPPASGSQQVASVSSQPPGHEQTQSVIPTAAMTHGAEFYQSLGRPSKAQENMQVPGQAQQPSPVSRAPSNNSTHSPTHRNTLQLPVAPSNGPFPAIPVSHTLSDASQATETGGSRQLHPQPTQTQQAASARSAPPMYSSAHDLSSTTSIHPHSVFPTHSHSQSHTLPSSLSHLYSISTIENAFSSPNDSANAPAAAPILASVVGSTTHQRYSYNQQSSSQSNVHKKMSINASSSAQTQSQTQTLLTSSNHVNPPLHTPNLHPHLSYSAVPVLSPPSHAPPTMLSPQSVHPPTALYSNSLSSRTHDVVYQAQQHPHQQQAPSVAVRPSLPQQNSNQSSFPSVRPPVPMSGSAASAIYVTSTRQSGPFVDDTPSSVGLGLSLDPPPSTSKPQMQQPPPPSGNYSSQSLHARPQNVNASASKPTRAVGQSHPSSQNLTRLRDLDSPPPLTPSSSSRDSHEEILMTPSSLDPARAQPVTVQRSDNQRSEKKKGGLFNLFRSNSSKSKGQRDQGDETRRQTPGRPENVNRVRSTKTVEAEPNPTRTDSVPVRYPRTSKRAPPPIAIPTHSIPYRLFSSKSKKYRTMSSASIEALDGTANNTVVGSPTSDRRSPTPSGPMSPPIRDPIEAAQEWRNNEEQVFVDRGSQRRRRPGVTFDVMEEELNPKDSSYYRLVRTSRLHGQRGDTPE